MIKAEWGSGEHLGASEFYIFLRRLRLYQYQIPGLDEAMTTLSLEQTITFEFSFFDPQSLLRPSG